MSFCEKQLNHNETMSLVVKSKEPDFAPLPLLLAGITPNSRYIAWQK